MVISRKLQGVHTCVGSSMTPLPMAMPMRLMRTWSGALRCAVQSREEEMRGVSKVWGGRGRKMSVHLIGFLNP
jgi:hypothetical protein